MTWKPNDARRYTDDAATWEKRKRWADIANEALGKSGDEGYAICAANEAVERRTRFERWRTRFAQWVMPS